MNQFMRYLQNDGSLKAIFTDLTVVNPDRIKIKVKFWDMLRYAKSDYINSRLVAF